MKRILARPVLIGIVILVIFLAVLLVFPTAKPLPPLPFDTSIYVAATNRDLFATSANTPVRQRLSFAIIKFLNRRKLEHPDPDNTTFGASPFGGEQVQVGLNSCAQASGTSYYMPPSVAVGTVPFPMTAPMKGGAFIAAFEKALTNAPINCLDTTTNTIYHKLVPQQLVLIRFPEQRAVLVLPQADADEFLRTNSAFRAKPN